jgi:hypothetical protein
MRNCIRKSIRPVLIICINKCSITILLVQGRLLPFSTAQPTKVSLYNCVLSISQSSCIYVNSQSCSSAPWPIHHITIVFVIIHPRHQPRGSIGPSSMLLLIVYFLSPPASPCALQPRGCEGCFVHEPGQSLQSPLKAVGTCFKERLMSYRTTATSPLDRFPSTLSRPLYI